MDRCPVKHRKHGIFAGIGIFFMLSAGKKEKGKGKRGKRKEKEGEKKRGRKEEKLYSTETNFRTPSAKSGSIGEANKDL